MPRPAVMLGGGMRVLIVDDDHESANTLARLLVILAGAEVECRYDGLDAVEAATAEGARFDVLITDIEMPRMDGIAATKRIRHASGGASPVAIAVSGRMGMDQEAELISTFDHLLLKPLDVDLLLSLLDKHCGREAP